MPAYGKVKVDTITYDLSGTATDVSVSNIATKASPTFTGTVTIPTPTCWMTIVLKLLLLLLFKQS